MACNAVATESSLDCLAGRRGAQGAAGSILMGEKAHCIITKATTILTLRLAISSEERGMPLGTEMKVALVGAAVAVGIAVIGGAYKLGYDEGAKDLEAVNDFRKVELPKLLANLKDLSADLQSRESLVKENGRLRSESTEKDKEISSLKTDSSRQLQELAAIKSQVTELRSEISKLSPGDEFNVHLSEGEAKRVMPNGLLTIGLVVNYGSFIERSINGSKENVKVGDKASVKVGDRECAVELVKIAKPEADFVVSCSKK